MAELTVDDVVAYTGGRLGDDDETARMLAAALAAARRDVGWHVSPVATGAVFLRNGPGGHKLRLPTQKVVTLQAVTDNGVDLDVGDSGSGGSGDDDPDVTVDPEAPWVLIRHHGHWSRRHAGIVVECDHGFTEDEAADWRQAILSMVDMMAGLSVTGRPDSDLQSKQVDDVVYRWGPAQALPGVEPILARYRLVAGWA